MISNTCHAFRTHCTAAAAKRVLPRRPYGRQKATEEECAVEAGSQQAKRHVARSGTDARMPGGATTRPRQPRPASTPRNQVQRQRSVYITMNVWAASQMGEGLV